MNELAALAPFLWWIMLLSSTAIILHDLATRAFAGESTHMISKPIRAPVQVARETATTNELISRSIEISSTGFQKEAAAAILEAALSARSSPLTKIPDSKLPMVSELLNDTELEDFIQVNSTRTTTKIDKKNLKRELERTYSMLERAERLFK
jgi:hypothetical protein